jgi:hypothetical protein
MFGKPMQIEKNIAKIEHDSDDYRILVKVESRCSNTITQEEVEIILTKEWPLLFTQRVRYGR